MQKKKEVQSAEKYFKINIKTAKVFKYTKMFRNKMEFEQEYVLFF